MKPCSAVRGTWDEPEGAAVWLGERLAEYAFRFAAEGDRDTARPTLYVDSAAERLEWGGDVSLGFYLEHPAYLSLAVVTCSPNRAKPELACPAARVNGTAQTPGRTRAAGGLSENSVGLRR